MDCTNLGPDCTRWVASNKRQRWKRW
jgi:hypothetical protein